MDGNRQSFKESFSPEEYDTSDDMSIEQLRHLVHIIDRSDVSELEVKRVSMGMRLVLRKAKATGNSDLQIVSPPAASAETEAALPADTKHTVVAPLVGIFHTWARPNGKPLVSVGDRVKIGQRVGTIQSLNVFNEVETLVAGRVVEILVQEGQPVEYGQPLMTIDGAEEA